jgi:hypothetical protein
VLQDERAAAPAELADDAFLGEVRRPVVSLARQQLGHRGGGELAGVGLADDRAPGRGAGAVRVGQRIGLGGLPGVDAERALEVGHASILPSCT